MNGHAPHVFFSRVDHRDSRYPGCECQRCTPTPAALAAHMGTIDSLIEHYLASSTPGEANRLWNDIERQSWRDAQDGKPVDQARLTAVFNQVVDRFEWRYMQPAVAVEGGYDCETSIVMISSPTFIGLRRGIRDLNPGSIPIDSPHDCTGRVCGRSAKLLSIYSNGGHHWVGVLEATVTRDV
jgi:hypothetical protein